MRRRRAASVVTASPYAPARRAMSRRPAAAAARGQDLRPNRNTDLIELVRAQAARNVDLAKQVGALRNEVDKLSSQQGGAVADTSGAAAAAGLAAVKGPAVTVTLTDAPAHVNPVGVAAALLIVHRPVRAGLLPEAHHRGQPRRVQRGHRARVRQTSTEVVLREGSLRERGSSCLAC